MTTVVTYYPGYSQVQVTDNLTLQEILSITKANPCVVTTVKNHNYTAGINIRFIIPGIFGMPQLNTVNCEVLSVTNNTLTLQLDTTGFTAFAYPSPLPSAYSKPYTIPNASSYALPPTQLPYGNQDTFYRAIYNNGEVGDPINGVS